MAALAGAAFLVLFAGRPALAAGLCADGFPPPEITTRFYQTSYSYDFSRSSDDLARLMSSDDARRRGVGLQRKVKGLTAGKFDSELRVTFYVKTTPAGQYCIAPAKMKLIYGFPAMTVYVVNRYGKTTCNHKAVFEHELEHVKLNQDALVKAKGYIETHMIEAATGSRFPIVAGSVEDAKNFGITYLSNRFQEAMDELNGYQRRVNAAIDTEHAYQKVLVRCVNW